MQQGIAAKPAPVPARARAACLQRAVGTTQRVRRGAAGESNVQVHLLHANG
jgi:hypothetical protein